MTQRRIYKEISASAVTGNISDVINYLTEIRDAFGDVEFSALPNQDEVEFNISYLVNIPQDELDCAAKIRALKRGPYRDWDHIAIKSAETLLRELRSAK